MFQDIQQLHMWSGFSGTDNYHPTSTTGSHGDSAPSFDAGLHHLYHHARAEPGTVHTQQLSARFCAPTGTSCVTVHTTVAEEAQWILPGSRGDTIDPWNEGLKHLTMRQGATSEVKPVHPTTRRHYPIGF
jgi:hypothetical protein